MTATSLVLLIAMVVLYAVGFTLMLDRGLTRILLGFLLVGNATNLLIFMMSTQLGAAPLAQNTSSAEMSDPLPQTFILTAIVITFAVSAFLLALIYRSFRQAVDNNDHLKDDEEDIELANIESDNSDEDIAESELADIKEFDNDDEQQSVGLSAGGDK